MRKTIKKKEGVSFFTNTKKWSLYIYLTVFAIYGNTLFNKYSLDDEFVIKDNKQVQQGIKSIPEIFTSQYVQSKESSFGYRPVTKAVFAIEYEFFGENPFVSHLINVLLYAITCILLLKLLIKVLLPKTGYVFVFITLLLWICHPLHTEVVASLKNREEIIYLILCLLSLKYFIHFYEKPKWYIFLAAIALYMLSYITKQSAISFIMIIPMVLWFLYYKNGSLGFIIQNNLKIIITVIALFFATYFLYNIPNLFFPAEKITLFSFENPLHIDHAIAAKIAVSAYAMLFNLKLLLIPHPLVFYYGQFTIPQVNISDVMVIFSLLLHATILFFTVKYLKNKSVIIFGTLFYLALRDLA